MAATAGCLWSWGTAPLAAGEVLDADPGWGSSSLLLDSFQKLITAIKVPGRSTHPPAFWVPRPRPPRAITTTCSQFPDSARSYSSPAAQWLEHPQVVTTSLDARSSRMAMGRASSSPRQRPSSGRPPSHCQPSSGQQEARCRNGRSCPSFSW